MHVYNNVYVQKLSILSDIFMMDYQVTNNRYFFIKNNAFYRILKGKTINVNLRFLQTNKNFLLLSFMLCHLTT